MRIVLFYPLNNLSHNVVATKHTVVDTDTRKPVFAYKYIRK